MKSPTGTKPKIRRLPSVPSLARNDQIIMRWGTRVCRTDSLRTVPPGQTTQESTTWISSGSRRHGFQPHGNHAQMNDSANPPKISVAIAGRPYNFKRPKSVVLRQLDKRNRQIG